MIIFLVMKKSVYTILIAIVIAYSCSTSKTVVTKETKNAIHGDTVRITNKELEYEVIIIDPGFSTWLISRAYPRGFHSQKYLETKNQIYVNEWNNRVAQPQRYNPNLYEMTIDYSPNIDYGYEVNYLIYNYFIYFQNTYKQELFGHVPLR